jgi:hypothetical protein
VFVLGEFTFLALLRNTIENLVFLGPADELGGRRVS